MELDMDLLRSLLEYVEKNDPYAYSDAIKISNYSEKLITYHVGLLLDNDYIKGYKENYQLGTLYMVERLTMNGHQLLELIRNDTIWKQIKKTFNKIGLVALPSLIPLVWPYIKGLLGMP